MDSGNFSVNLMPMFQRLVDGLASAVLLCAEKGKVLYHNQSALVCLSRGDGLALSNGRLVASVSPENPRLRDLLAMPIESLPPTSAVQVARPAEAAPYTLFLHPLLDRPIGATALRGLLLIIIVDPVARHGLGVGTLREIYGLTAAELRVADGLLKGLSLNEISVRNGTSINTVRTQLKQLFFKTETRRQIDLVDLLDASLPVFQDLANSETMRIEGGESS